MPPLWHLQSPIITTFPFSHFAPHPHLQTKPSFHIFPSHFPLHFPPNSPSSPKAPAIQNASFRSVMMGQLPCDDAVLIQQGKKAGEPWIITVNCPCPTGLASDIFRTILDFDLFISKGDISTDGKWCYIQLWVVPQSDAVGRWSSLKDRLAAICPPCSLPYCLRQQTTPKKSSVLYLLTFCSLNRSGLLHDVTRVLSELELSIEKMKVNTTPDGRVLDLFFIRDNLDLLHKRERQEETCERLRSVLGESCVICALQLADSQHGNKHEMSLSPSISNELFHASRAEKECHKQGFKSDLSESKRVNVNIDNSLCPSHTLLQIQCEDHKGLLYDILRTVKDHDIQIAYGRFSEVTKGERTIDLFIHSKERRKIIDPEEVYQLCSRLKADILHPLRVMIVNRGPDLELLVANPVESSSHGRPRVFYDVTLALKSLDICIFSAETGRYMAFDREWEVYRFLLDELNDSALSSLEIKSEIIHKVRGMLM